MRLQLNTEGVQYMLGLPLEDPKTFSQVILNPGEVEGLPPEISVASFEKLEDARRVREFVQQWCHRRPGIYEVRIQQIEA